MTIRVALNHTSIYRYSEYVQLSPHVIRLRPAAHCRTPILSYSLRCLPEKHYVNWQQDPQGNFQARVVMNEPTRELRVSVDLVAEMTVINPFDFFVEPEAEHWPFAYSPELKRDLKPYLETCAAGPRFAAYMAGINRKPTGTTVDYLVELNRKIAQLVGYLIRLEPGVQTPEETLTKGSGSCRDSAWLLVQVLRQLGLAARFTSGYLIQLSADLKSLDGPSGPEKDFTDLHAWTEVYIPGAGWIGLDPTSGLMAGEGHIPLACTPDFQAAAPISGAFSAADGVTCDFSVEMQLTRIHEDPRTTKPYLESQWEAILAMGDHVDEDLRAGDVRLTMGGEPTFVSIDDMDGAEWTVDALGTHKRLLAGNLVRRLRRVFAPGALYHAGQGKWYPGEPLPRWALGLFWRRDGIPVWRDPELFADEATPPGHEAQQAKRFAHELGERLGIDSRFTMPAYEDAWYYLWKERKLPINVDPLDSKLDNAQERARLARLFETGLNRVAGYVMPLAPLRRTKESGATWQSGPWFLRQEHLFLMPGDSPIGYRLPLDSLPWATPGDLVGEQERDPLEPRGALPPTPYQSTARFARRGARMQSPGASGEPSGAAAKAPAPGRSAGGLTRTALCIEPRNGILHIFLPPVPLLEDWLDLVATIEDTAQALSMGILLEGYTPPRDHRLNHLAVTPDPGVIEVNIHPAHSWRDLVSHTTTLYEEARQCRLGTEKFMLDGRHTGTGGGNHMTLGGITPADSPFLRRPDLLRSMLAYWHNHPSLSYLFSGLFIGPTSQAPRPDEARTETTYELELALSQLPDRSTSPPWLVDRVLRHLLIDLTGNTHRAQFSIDKLYSPDSASGRLGLLELRSMEMPPHARMSCAQQLLVRALIARFWNEPYHAPLANWGTQLHDRFMLPFFIEQDFQDVTDELGGKGYQFEPSWFAPHREFRFPRIGEIAHRGIRLDLRHALEPWHVLGEEASGGGMARYVDSSLERVQVTVLGATGDRHVVAVNGVALPLQPTGRASEFVAGVRYRAWQPPSCLHPTIGVHAPLVFDLVDTWNGRSVAGCTYHVSNPSGRNSPSFPINANEAEARRGALFSPHGHTPGPLSLKVPARDLDYPFTLDLRKFG